MTTGRNSQPDDKAVAPPRSDQQIVLVFKALSHPFRVELLRYLSEDSVCVCYLVERAGRAQPYVSQQLSVLRRAALVTAWRDGQQVHYGINQDRLRQTLSLVAEIGGVGRAFGPVTAPVPPIACCSSASMHRPVIQETPMSTNNFLKPWHGIPREEIAWSPTVIADRCVGCGLCVTSCGRQVYAFDYEANRPVVVNPLHCMVGCTTCATVCTQDALEFPSRGFIRQVVRGRKLLRHAKDELKANREKYDVVQRQTAAP